MEAEGNSPPVKGDEIPTHFVVELRKGVYVICERVTVLDQASNLPIDLIESYLERYRLRAAPLPGGSGDGSRRHGVPPGLHEAFMAFQTGRAPLVNVTIHNDVTNDPKSG